MKIRSSIVLSLLGLCPLVHAYGHYGNTAGRLDFASNYDIGARLRYAGQSNATVYDFGKIGDINGLPPGVAAGDVLSAVQGATAGWSQYLNVKYDSTGMRAVNTGTVRLRYDATRATGAYADGIVGATAGQVDYAEIVFGRRPSAGAAWTAQNFAWTLKHELGHTLGLIDLYENTTEDFVDHDTNLGAGPSLDYDSRRDNIMFQINNGNNYNLAPVTDIDNDDILGAAQLWGSSHSFIHTGKLAAAYGAGNFPRRGSAEHHGQNNAKKWTYRGNFGTNRLTSGKPYIDIEFWGYQGFTGSLWGAGSAAAFQYMGEVSPNLHRFEVNRVDFLGNFELTLESRYEREARMYAQVVSGNNGTSFSLERNLNGLAHSVNFGNHRWANVFGAVPEPNSLLVLALGGVALMRRKR
ncbi:MAG: PEP-CTERM sorting domain-containing protein [Armatimonadetes bacterium]|nr:PEP-CTERM sorting domain-containing protein [Armatimonadota bacterium]